MTDPKIEILGVYRLGVTEELFRKQFKKLYDYEMTDAERGEAEENCRNQLSSVVLVEAIVKGRDNRFDVSDFAQGSEDEPADSWQVACGEVYLTMDGKSLMVKSPSAGDLRFAFFMHYWDSAKPLMTSYRDIVCPHVQEMPERLKILVPYVPVD